MGNSSVILKGLVCSSQYVNGNDDVPTKLNVHDPVVTYRLKHFNINIQVFNVIATELRETSRYKTNNKFIVISHNKNTSVIN